MSEIFALNLIAEARMRSLVLLYRKYQSTWDKQTVEDHLKRLASHCSNKIFEEPAIE